MKPESFGIDGRGQFVLLAGLVVALALVAMLTAYLQLGYHADVAAGDVERPVTDSTTFLARATHAEATGLRGEFAWTEREAAVSAMHDRILSRLETLERARVSEGVVVQASLNGTVANERADDYCDSGSGRAFGPCRAIRGVVVQERTARTLVVAVGYDLSLTTRDSTTRLTTIVNATD
jgi:hypothetical protein